MVMNATNYISNMTNGHPFVAVFSMYNDAFGGYFLLLLYITFRILLMVKVKNALTGWIVTVLFLALYISMYNATNYFTHSGLAIIFFVIIFELGATLYSMFIK